MTECQCLSTKLQHVCILCVNTCRKTYFLSLYIYTVCTSMCVKLYTVALFNCVGLGQSDYTLWESAVTSLKIVTAVFHVLYYSKSRVKVLNNQLSGYMRLTLSQVIASLTDLVADWPVLHIKFCFLNTVLHCCESTVTSTQCSFSFLCIV